MSVMQKQLRVLTEHNSDGTHNQAAATTLQTKTGWGITTQTNVSASRVVGNVYQNTSGKPMWVRVSASLASQNTFLTALSDGANPPVLKVDEMDTATNGRTITVGFWVLNDHFYKIVAGSTATVGVWVEWN